MQQTRVVLFVLSIKRVETSQLIRGYEKNVGSGEALFYLHYNYCHTKRTPIVQYVVIGL